MAHIKAALCIFLMVVILESKLASAEGCDDKFDKAVNDQCKQLITNDEDCDKKLNDDGTYRDICEKTCDPDCREEAAAEKRGKRPVERAQQWFFEARRQECTNDDSQCPGLVAAKGKNVCEDDVIGSGKKIKDYCNLSCEVC
ncbi:uncharacterized protein [Amphiura filiformis]|uniref:uncharacterized protein n=1 Tax=Amphiura filiformis TaxID=82378 RepID=UPI003B2258B8